MDMGFVLAMVLSTLFAAALVCEPGLSDQPSQRLASYRHAGVETLSFVGLAPHLPTTDYLSERRSRLVAIEGPAPEADKLERCPARGEFEAVLSLDERGHAVRVELYLVGEVRGPNSTGYCLAGAFLGVQGDPDRLEQRSRFSMEAA